MSIRFALVVAAGTLLLGAPGVYAQTTPPLDELSLQDLLNVEVTSVARKEQTIARTAAAVYVITAEDIRRFGARTLPDVLRLAPGVSVQQINASQWSVTARGSGGLLANKLLVLIDGRSIYSPLFGGVYWHAQHVPIDGIDRIEVIRGPGGSLWGANAINGVINIIMKRADTLQGISGNVSVGSHDPGSLNARYGGRIRGAYWAANVEFAQGASPGTVAGISNGDALEAGHADARIDWQHGAHEVTATADVRTGTQRLVTESNSLAQGNSLPFTGGSGRLTWTHTVSSRNQRTLQVYGAVDNDTGLQYSWNTNTADVDFRQRLTRGRHDVVTGAEYRVSHSVSSDTGPQVLNRREIDVQLFTAFLQDEVALGDGVALTPGIKIEKKFSASFEIQPSLRALWLLTPRQSVWAAVSRAVRTPNAYDQYLQITQVLASSPGQPQTQVAVSGNPNIKSEVGRNVEAGYRIQRGRFGVDLAAFVGESDGLLGEETGTPSLQLVDGQPVLVIPVMLANTNRASVAGGEASVTWIPTAWWRLVGSYSHVSVRMTEHSKTAGPVPPNRYAVNTAVDLPGAISLSGYYFRAAAIPAEQVASYSRLDGRVAWAPTAHVEISGGVRNLLHGGTIEFGSDTLGTTVVPAQRETYVQLTWRLQ